MSFLFTAEALFSINHTDKSYIVQSYEDLKALASLKAEEIAKSHESTPAGTDVELKLTNKADTISGFRAHKILKMIDGKTDAEIWVSSDLVPLNLRAAGEKIRSVLPEGYWKRIHGSPGLIEIVMLFGVPLKIVNNGHVVYQVQIREDSSIGASFQVPSGYRKVGS